MLSYGQKQTHGKKPNILFIAIDDLNDWVGSLGGHPAVDLLLSTMTYRIMAPGSHHRPWTYNPERDAEGPFFFSFADIIFCGNLRYCLGTH